MNLTGVQGDVFSACPAVLRNNQDLLLIDNCEHLLDAIRDTVNAVLSACPELTVLATSREPLGIAAEYTFRLVPLRLPNPDEEGDRDLPRVASVAVFLDRLDRSLDLLGGAQASADARHRTLRATIAWSYQLLSEEEQRLFRHLSVFVDGVDVDTAEGVAAELGLDGDPGIALAHLVDASMIEVDFTGRTRYRMLETPRMFGGGDGDRAVRHGQLPRTRRDPRLGQGAGRRPGAGRPSPAAAVLGIAAEATYEDAPREYELSVAQTVPRVHTRVADLYNDPMNQVEQQLRLTTEALPERQESEVVNNRDFGLLHNADLRQRIQIRTGPPTPEDLDELLSRRRKTRFFYAHPRAIAAFGMECTRRGLYPDPVQVGGVAAMAWRGVPMLPCDKIPISHRGTTSIRRPLCLHHGLLQRRDRRTLESRQPDRRTSHLQHPPEK